MTQITHHSLRVRLGVGFFCVGCHDPGDCLSLVPVWFVRIGFWKGIWLEMGGDCFQTHEKKSWVSGQVRVERVLADAITIDDRKDLQVLFRDQCVDAGALQELREQHPHGFARQAQGGGVREE